MSFFQYLKDTRSELRHVAWPTRLQTIVYTVIVILLSVFIALYLGLFDFLFTTGLRSALRMLPQNNAPQSQLPTTPIATPATEPIVPSSNTDTNTGKN